MRSIPFTIVTKVHSSECKATAFFSDNTAILEFKLMYKGAETKCSPNNPQHAAFQILLSRFPATGNLCARGTSRREVGGSSQGARVTRHFFAQGLRANRWNLFDFTLLFRTLREQCMSSNNMQAEWTTLWNCTQPQNS